MRKVLMSAVAVALVFPIGCAQETGEQEAAPAAAGEEAAVAAPASRPAMAMKAVDRQAVPLTITMPKEKAGNDAIGRVRFPDVRPDSIFARDSTVERQYLVGQVLRDTVTDRFRFVIETFKGQSSNSAKETVSFGATAVCKNIPQEPQGTIRRIACAATKGSGALSVICSAIYDYSGDPPEKCEGTYACVKCQGGVKVCSENPQCF